ncbi:MAG: cation diffusion facilitator family transporter [Tepidisphaeraceae bacterium]|jgi:cation diffusion facilitator family transporter
MFPWFKNVPRVEARAAFISLGVGILLLSVKFTAYFLTGSAAVFSDAVESIVNVLASTGAVWALSLAHTPADADHPYGHGKAEFLSAGFEGGMILLAGVVMTFKAMDTLFLHPAEMEKLGIGVVLLVVAVFVNGGIGIYLVRLGTTTGALSLEADGQHLMSDAVTSFVAAVSLLVMSFTRWRWLDPAGALVIAAYISRIGIRLLRRSAAGLMDEQDMNHERTTRRILDTHVGRNGTQPRICGYHKLRHRHSGRYVWVDVHFTVAAGLSVREGHEIASVIEGEIERKLGQADATAHIEPCPGCELCRVESRQCQGHRI